MNWAQIQAKSEIECVTSRLTTVVIIKSNISRAAAAKNSMILFRNKFFQLRTTTHEPRYNDLERDLKPGAEQLLWLQLDGWCPDFCMNYFSFHLCHLFRYKNSSLYYNATSYRRLRRQNLPSFPLCVYLRVCIDMYRQHPQIAGS